MARTVQPEQAATILGIDDGLRGASGLPHRRHVLRAFRPARPGRRDPPDEDDMAVAGQIRRVKGQGFFAFACCVHAKSPADALAK